MWNLTSCNAVYEKLLLKKEKARFKDALKNVKPCIHNLPKTNLTINSSKGSKKQRIVIDRYNQIDSENKALLDRMQSIDSKPSRLSRSVCIPWTNSYGSLNYDLRNRNLSRIVIENKKILSRLQRVSPVMSREKIDFSKKKRNAKSLMLQSITKFNSKQSSNAWNTISYFNDFMSRPHSVSKFSETLF